MAIRDLGKAIVDLSRPDGGSAIDNALSTFLPKGTVTNITDLNPLRAIDKVISGASSILPNPNKPIAYTKNLPAVIPNPLENFAHYSPLWTLACLTPEQFNNPASYRNSPADLKHIIISSAGRYDSQRVQTASGTPEFFINNFTMKATVAANEKTGNSNAFKFEWDIYEPYSMGLLLQSLQIAAKNAKYANYLNNAPYVLRLDFAGYDETGKIYTSIKPKFFTLKLTGIKFQVTESGSSYKMEAVPYNHQGFSDSVNISFNDIAISGDVNGKGTVEELLSTGEKSLTRVLNKIEAGLVEDRQIQFPDEYEIQFPKTSSDFTRSTQLKTVNFATVDPNKPPTTVAKGTKAEVKLDFDKNDIGGSSLGFSQEKGGTFVMKKNDQRDPKTGLISRDKMTIDPKNRVFQFAQKQTLTSIINQIILSSEYVKEAIDPKNVTPEGFIKWFRLDVQVELKEYDDWIGDYAKKFTYRVVPFLVHQSIFSPPSSAMPYQELQKKICKGYEYIYTGQNVDVLKFDIQINNLFFAGINPSAEKNTAKATDQNTASGTATQKNKETKTSAGASPGSQLATLGRRRIKRSAALIDQKVKGGSRQTDTEQQVAQSFHNAFVNGSSADLVTINLEILGDPYWMIDSGIGNYFSRPTAPGSQITEDGTMNYESGDVYIYLTFKTPVDVNESTGLYDFPYSGKESPFSGIYKVVMCESIFSEGGFRQKLQCVRMPGQATDYTNNPQEVNSSIIADKATSFAKIIGGNEKEKVSPGDDPGYNQTDASGQGIF
jgi:hypothetical protein